MPSRLVVDHIIRRCHRYTFHRKTIINTRTYIHKSMLYNVYIFLIYLVLLLLLQLQPILLVYDNAVHNLACL